jgi:hypothetical protein
LAEDVVEGAIVEVTVAMHGGPGGRGGGYQTWQTYQDYSKQKMVNGVDISDVTHGFTEDEWNKLPVCVMSRLDSCTT